MAEIEIMQVHAIQSGADLNDEYIVIQNQSTDRYHIVGWSVAERTFGRQARWGMTSSPKAASVSGAAKSQNQA